MSQWLRPISCWEFIENISFTNSAFTLILHFENCVGAFFFLELNEGMNSRLWKFQTILIFGSKKLLTNSYLQCITNFLTFSKLREAKIVKNKGPWGVLCKIRVWKKVEHWKGRAFNYFEINNAGYLCYFCSLATSFGELEWWALIRLHPVSYQLPWSASRDHFCPWNFLGTHQWTGKFL